MKCEVCCNMTDRYKCPQCFVR